MDGNLGIAGLCDEVDRVSLLNLNSRARTAFFLSHGLILGHEVCEDICDLVIITGLLEKNVELHLANEATARAVAIG